MEPHREEMPAEYELHPEQDTGMRPVRVATRAVTLAILAITVATAAVAVSVVCIIMTLHATKASNSQAMQIRMLDQSNTRLAGEVSALSNRQTQTSARLAATQSAASDPSLITCSDLRHMDLIATSGGSGNVSSVPGTVIIDLSQSRVPLPGHCSK